MYETIGAIILVGLGAFLYLAVASFILLLIFFVLAWYRSVVDNLRRVVDFWERWEKRHKNSDLSTFTRHSVVDPASRKQ